LEHREDLVLLRPREEAAHHRLHLAARQRDRVLHREWCVHTALCAAAHLPDERAAEILVRSPRPLQEASVGPSRKVGVAPACTKEALDLVGHRPLRGDTQALRRSLASPSSRWR
jgi:hypothetical protein